MSAREQLDQLDKLWAAGTAGEWTHEHDDYGDEWWFGGNRDGGQETINGHIVTDADHAPDAALIVAAVNALPPHVAALRDILELADDCDAIADKLREDDMDEFAFAYDVTAERIRTAITEALDSP